MNRMERAVPGMEAGLTLIELIVGLCVLAILTALAAPSFTQYLRNTEITAAQNDIVTAFNLARTEALRRSKPVSVCASLNGSTCANTESWSAGWIVFVDESGVRGTLDAVDRLVQSWSGPAAAQIGVDSEQNVSNVQYTVTGALAPLQPRVFIINTALCPQHSRKLTVTVSPVGVVRNKRETCA